MEPNYKNLTELMNVYGDAFYLLDTERFRRNFQELKKAFCEIYPNFNIAYSYKTNYTPAFCKIVDELGGYAEVVSDMELDIASKAGVKADQIIWNGPYKNYGRVESFLLAGGTVNLDSVYEIELLEKIARSHPDRRLNAGIRCNFDVNDGVISRFGFDVASDAFQTALRAIGKHDNIRLKGLHCHFATRKLETWKPRAVGMLDLVEKLGFVPEHIDLGGGLFGKMPESLQAQFDSYIPSYTEYAREVMPFFAEKFGDSPDAPQVLIEPGSAIVGDCMKFVTKVVNIKTVRTKSIATVLGSIYNINPTLNKKNPPIEVLSDRPQTEYEDLDFGGFTCIESDYLYRHYRGKLAVGDIVVFGNVGSYSVVLKPPFILPNFPVLEIGKDKVETVKRAETFDDLFRTFAF